MTAARQAPPQRDIEVFRLHYGAGNMATAERLATELTRKFPDHAFGWKALAAIADRTGRLDVAAASLREAIRLEPEDADTNFGLGNALYGLGRLGEAEGGYREAVRLQPNHAAAHCNLGNTLKDLGRPREAEDCYRTAIRVGPDIAVAHFNLANVLKDLDRPAEAEASYRDAIRLMPDLAEAHYNLGNTLKELERPDDAEAGYREAIRIKPDHIDARNNLGNVFRESGRLPEAEAAYREAIRLKPDYADAHANLGIALHHLGRLREAEASYREAIRLDPDHAEARSNLGVTLGELGCVGEAEASYREALRLKPDAAAIRSNLLFCLNGAEPYAPDAALAEAKRYGSIVSSRAVPKFPSWNASARDAKMRIGFVSGDLRNHPVGYFLEGLVANLDRNAFELFAFPTGPKTDELTSRLKPHFRSWISLCGKSDRAAAATIHAQAIHVLLDLSGHTAENRLPVFAHKPAPVQASWLGYFATTGLPEMDYFLGDPHVCPASEDRNFTERLWRLPATWLCLTPPDATIPVGAQPALRDGHATFGCFGNLAKMGDPVVKTWAEILARVPDSKLFLKSKQLADGSVVAATKRRFQAHGIPGDRLILEGPSPRSAYLEAYNRVDLVLDTFPHPGGTTSSEALWMGVPVLTLAGARFLSRLGESIARNVGLEDWIAADPEAYVRKAAAFAADLRGLAAIRATLRERALRSPLFDARRFAADFGAALSEMYAAYGRRAAPA
jgi:protein O-GlcNAc transferase